MSPDDPRHGQPKGYYAGCRLECCRRAAARYEKQRRLDKLRGRPARLVPVIGSRRRIQALARLGWSYAEQAKRLGCSTPALQRSIEPGREWVTRRRHDQIVKLYEQLSMRPGPSQVTAHRAARKGWPPPMAWNDPDNPQERAKGTEAGVLLVRRVGDHSLDAMRASHTAYRRGVRTELVVAGEKAYQRWSHKRDEEPA